MNVFFMTNKFINTTTDKFSDKQMQPDLTVLQRQDSFKQTSTDKKENKYFPRFAFLKISKKFAAHLHVAACGGWASPTACKRAAIILLPLSI